MKNASQKEYIYIVYILYKKREKGEFLEKRRFNNPLITH